MYFWKIEQLKKDIVAEKLSEKDRFIYVMISLVLTWALIAVPFEADFVSSTWEAVDIFGNIAIPFVGTYLFYRANGGNQGNDVLGRYFSIGFVVSIRYAAILIPVTMVSSIVNGIIFPDAVEDMLVTPIDVVVFQVWYVLYFANMIKHVSHIHRASTDKHQAIAA